MLLVGCHVQCNCYLYKNWKHAQYLLSKTTYYKDSSRMETIRGLLEVYIGEATGLPDTDSSWFSSSKDTTDAYVKVQPHLWFIVTNHLF